MDDFGPLAEIVNLRELHLESCRLLLDLSPIASSRQLRFLNVAECGDIASLRPLAGIADLEIAWMYGTTRVLDDDLTPLAGLLHLAELRMKSRKSYRPSVEQLRSIIGSRQSA